MIDPFSNIEPPAGLRQFQQRQRDDEAVARQAGHLRDQTQRFVVDDDAPMRLAEHFVEFAGLRHPATVLLRRWREEWWRYRGTWRMTKPEALAADVRVHLDRIDVRRGQRTEPLRVTTRLVGEVASALIRRDPATFTTIVEEDHGPLWLDERKTPAATALIGFADGLLDVDAWLGGRPAFEPASPAWFGGPVLPHAFREVESSPEPTAWNAFLADIFGDDVEAVQLLQEWFGYVISGDCSQQKILLLVGPPRAGKSTIERVLEHVAGLDNCASPTLGSLGTNFGLWPLLNKSLCVISDARLSGRADQQAVTERLLSISGEDSLTIDRKNQCPITTRLGCRLVIVSNELPRLTDQSGALANRFLIVQLRRSFLGAEDTTLAQRLLRELPSIIRWSLAGLRQLRARGRFIEPGEAKEIRSELSDLASPISAFIRECCRVGSDEHAPKKLVWAAFRAWAEDRNLPYASDAVFARDLRSALPTIRAGETVEDGDRIKLFRGLGLNLAAAETARMYQSRHGGGHHAS